jgi:hypothetical protein
MVTFYKSMTQMKITTDEVESPVTFYQPNVVPSGNRTQFKMIFCAKTYPRCDQITTNSWLGEVVGKYYTLL